MVFQSYALYPHMSVFDNMAFGLKLRKLPKQEIQQRVEKSAKILGIDRACLSGNHANFQVVNASAWRWVGQSYASQKCSSWTNHFEPGCQIESANPRRDQQTHHQARYDLCLRDPRPDGSHDHGQSYRSNEKGNCSSWIPPQVLYDKPANMFVAGFIGTPAMKFLHHETGEGRRWPYSQITVRKLKDQDP